MQIKWDHKTTFIQQLNDMHHLFLPAFLVIVVLSYSPFLSILLQRVL